MRPKLEARISAWPGPETSCTSFMAGELRKNKARERYGAGRREGEIEQRERDMALEGEKVGVDRVREHPDRSMSLVLIWAETCDGEHPN